MKQLFLYFAAFVLAIGFANADVSENNNKKASESANCPYLNSIVNSGNSTECPFISDKSNVKNECPYNDEIEEGNSKIQKKNKPRVEIKSS